MGIVVPIAIDGGRTTPAARSPLISSPCHETNKSVPRVETKPSAHRGKKIAGSERIAIEISAIAKRIAEFPPDLDQRVANQPPNDRPRKNNPSTLPVTDSVAPSRSISLRVQRSSCDSATEPLKKANAINSKRSIKIPVSETKKNQLCHC